MSHSNKDVKAKMNYIRIYISLCRSRLNKEKNKDVYSENHHIFPVSIFGKNNKTVNLTPREHYIAHLLLYKIYRKRYGNHHKYTFKMANALIMMISNNQFVPRFYPSRYVELSRQIWRENWKNPMNDPKNRKYGKDNYMYNIGNNHPLFGTKRSDETKQKIGKANKGKLTGDNNPSKRTEVRDKISKNRKNKGLFTRNNHPKTILNEDTVKEILLLWQKEKKEGLSGYRFCRKYNERYKVKPSTIGNLIFKKN